MKRAHLGHCGICAIKDGMVRGFLLIAKANDVLSLKLNPHTNTAEKISGKNGHLNTNCDLVDIRNKTKKFSTDDNEITDEEEKCCNYCKGICGSSW